MVRHGSVVLPYSEEPAAQNLREHAHSGITWHAHFVFCHTLVLPHLIVNLKLLNSTEIQEHPQRGSDHGVVVQGEVIEVKLIDAQLNAKGDLSCLQGGGRIHHTSSSGTIQPSYQLFYAFYSRGRYLEPVNFHFGAGCMVGQHLGTNRAGIDTGVDVSWS